MTYYEVTLLFWNILVMFIYGVDKLLAKARQRRISEATLLFCAASLGAFGAMFGMVLFNHKTSKPKFRIFVPMLVVIEIFALYCGIEHIN